MKRLILISFIIVSLTQAGCSYTRDRKINFTIEKLNQMGFDRSFWLTDTLGCDAKRKTFYASFLRKKGALDNLSKDEILKILGKPFVIKSNKDNTSFFYSIDGRVMCDNLKLRNVRKTSDNSYLVLSFDNRGKLMQIATSIP